MNSNAVTAVTFAGIWVWFGTFAYIAPTVVAAAREVRGLGQVAVVNVLLGWTVIGWIVALVMALKPQPPPYPQPYPPPRA